MRRSSRCPAPPASTGSSSPQASTAFNIAGLKTALIVTAKRRPRAAVSRPRSITDHTGLLGVLVAEAAFTAGDAWLDAVGCSSSTATARCWARCSSSGLPDITWNSPQASYLAWLDRRRLGLGDNPAEALLSQGRVALFPRLLYGPAGATLDSTSAPAREHLTNRIERITCSLAPR